MTISKVLIVDDSPADLSNLKGIVEGAGYSVITATSGQDAIDKSKSLAPDLIFMDVVMSGTDGFTACRTITQDSATKKIPIVFVTSKNQKADRVWGELQGGKAMVTKPYSPEQILEQLKSF